MAAVHQLLGRDHGLGALVDANTIRDGARSAHSPARSAVGLFVIRRYGHYYLVRNKRTGYDLKKPNDFAGGSGGYAP